MSFRLDPRIQATSHALTDLALCEARLQDDARFAWIVLAPRRAAPVEIADLDEADQAALWAETQAAGAAVRAIGEALGRRVFKLNHGQLGNVVAQLHVHVVGRRKDDAAWPGPVWGAGVAEPYAPDALATALKAARAGGRARLTPSAARAWPGCAGGCGGACSAAAQSR